MVMGNFRDSSFSMDIGKVQFNSCRFASLLYTPVQESLPQFKVPFRNYRETYATNLTITSVKSHEKKGTTKNFGTHFGTWEGTHLLSNFSQ